MKDKKGRWIITARPHLACFECRVSFKDISVCPHCHKPLINMGTRFKAPRRNNMRDWKRLHLIYLAGGKFRSWDSASTVRDAKALLERAWRDNPIDKHK